MYNAEFICMFSLFPGLSWSSTAQLYNFGWMVAMGTWRSLCVCGIRRLQCCRVDLITAAVGVALTQWAWSLMACFVWEAWNDLRTLWLRPALSVKEHRDGSVRHTASDCSSSQLLFVCVVVLFNKSDFSYLSLFISWYLFMWGDFGSLARPSLAGWAWPGVFKHCCISSISRFSALSSLMESIVSTDQQQLVLKQPVLTVNQKTLWSTVTPLCVIVDQDCLMSRIEMQCCTSNDLLLDKSIYSRPGPMTKREPLVWF